MQSALTRGCPSDFDFLPITCSKCQLQIESFFLPFITVLSSFLAWYPHISLTECISVLLAMGRTMCFASFSSVAFQMLLTEKPDTMDKGWWLLRTYTKMHCLHEKGSVRLSLRFGKYFKFYVLQDEHQQWSKCDWRNVITQITPAFKLIQSLSKIKQDDYNCLYQII